MVAVPGRYPHGNPLKKSFKKHYVRAKIFCCPFVLSAVEREREREREREAGGGIEKLQSCFLTAHQTCKPQLNVSGQLTSLRGGDPIVLSETDQIFATVLSTDICFVSFPTLDLIESAQQFI